MALGKIPGSNGHEDEDLAGVFADINITPLTDIFLVLLIIFMVTSTVIVNRETGGARAGLKVNLPQGAASDVSPRESDLSIAVLGDGRLVLAGTVVNADELDRALKDTHAKAPDTMVIIQADEGVPHGHVVAVMEAAKKAGLAQVAIGVREASPGR